MNSANLKLLLLIIAIVCLFCTSLTAPSRESNYTSGGGNETVVGSLLECDSSVALNTEVFLIPSDYIPLPENSNRFFRDTTDLMGVYKFKGVPQGRYNIYARQLDRRTSSLKTDIRVLGEHVIVDVSVLKKPKTVKIDLTNISINPVHNSCLYIPGTPLIVPWPADNYAAIIDSVPEGDLPSIVYLDQNNDSSKVLRNDVHTDYGDTTFIFMIDWKNMQKLYFNTSSSGADIATNQTKFPILLRINKSIFDFSSAQPNGFDIRFTKVDNTPLPFEIEQWDKENENAEIWIKVDTIYAADSNQNIVMYWGNTLASNASEPEAVFDTSDILCAMHLNKNSYDATDHHNNGKCYGTIDTIGMIGKAMRFDGNDSICIDGLFSNRSNVTISAWALLEKKSDLGADLISIGDAIVLRMDDVFSLEGTLGSIYCTPPISYFNVASNRYLAKTGWHYLTFSVDSIKHTQKLFIDGVVAGTGNIQSMIDYSEDKLGKNTIIGNHGANKSGYGFNGCIDEVRIYKSIPNDDRVKLCYMNQKASDALIYFRKQ
jgi:hypothetical protein